MITTLIALALGQDQAADPVRNFLPAGKSAYFALSPEPVALGNIFDAKWSADGATLVFVRTEVILKASTLKKVILSGEKISIPQELISWNPLTKKLKSLLKIDSERGVITNFELLGNRSVIVAQACPQPIAGSPSLARVDLSSGEVSPLLAFPYEAFEVSASKKGSILGVRVIDTSKPQPFKDSMYFLTEKGASYGPYVQENRSMLAWAGDSEQPILMQFTRTSTPGKPKRTTQAIDIKTGKLSPYEIKKGSSAWRGDDFRVTTFSGRMAFPTGSTYAGGLLMTYEGQDRLSKDRGMVVSTDAKNGWPSQDGRYVAYVSQGMLLVRELAKVPREEYEAALQEAEQQFIMGQAKQAALGLIMYASDNNDILPPSGDVSSLVRPYMKQDFPFTYTYTGGSMSNIENPATTVLGYVDGSNGRAIIHADGHVTWKK